MASKRKLLDSLKREELQEAVDHYELEVRDRRVREQLIDALSGSKKARIAEILDDLPRIRLTEPPGR